MKDTRSVVADPVADFTSESHSTGSRAADSVAAFLLLPTVAMSLGWGLRGTIGGGPYGAMIPGAIVMLCLCHLLRWKNSLGIVVAIGTVGVALGGQETYGQTIGFLRDPKSIFWGLSGLTIKGAMWGLSGGILVGLAFMHSKYRWWEIAIGLGLMLAATVFGREFVDSPKYVYFSNLLDKPREELWVGLTLGALALLVYLLSLRREKISALFAAGGILAGAAGFGGGSLFLALGLSLPRPYFNWPWWKMMEFTFGALYGLGLGAVAFWLRDTLRQTDREMSRPQPFDPLSKLPTAITIVLGLTLAMGFVPSRLIGLVPAAWNQTSLPDPDTAYRASYSILGAELILICLLSNRLAWQVALSMTICGFLGDFLREGPKRQWFDDRFDHWGYVLSLTLPVVLIVARSKEKLTASAALLALVWFATPFGLAKMIIPHDGKLPSIFVSIVFVTELLLTTLLVLWSQPVDSKTESRDAIV